MAITGPADGAPYKSGVAIVDVLAGWSAVTAILAGLAARERDGAGSHVKTNLVSTGLAALVNVGGAALMTGREASRHGNAHASIEPYRSFSAADGDFLLAVGTDRQFAVLCERVLGRPDLGADARFAAKGDRPAAPRRGHGEALRRGRARGAVAIGRPRGPGAPPHLWLTPLGPSMKKIE